MRLGKCLLGSSITTCRLVTRNSRPSRSKKNPLAPVSGRLPSKGETRVAVSSSGSIMGVFIAGLADEGNVKSAEAVFTSRSARHILVIAGFSGPIDAEDKGDRRVIRGQESKYMMNQRRISPRAAYRHQASHPTTDSISPPSSFPKLKSRTHPFAP